MTELTELDLRNYPRAVFQCHARVAVENKPPIEGWTVDISRDGISLTLAEPIEPGQYCVIQFEAVIKRMPRPFSAIARSVYRMSNSIGQYRTGFQFSQLGTENAAIIDELAH